MSNSPRANLLVVDDEPHTRLALRELLHAPDRNVVLAGSGEEALRRLLNDDFALILLDVRMPGMDGFETATLIRGRRRSQHTPIIFLTGAHEDLRSVFRGYEVGAVDYMLKPVEPDVLKSKVSVFVEIFNKRAALATQILHQQDVERDLSRENEDLETKIRERTASLIAANDMLQKEIDLREKVEENLRMKEAEARKLSLVASRTENAVIIQDAYERVEWVNDSFTRIYGYALDEAKGRKLREFLIGPEAEPPPAESGIESEAGRKLEVSRYSKSGDLYWLAIERRPIFDQCGDLTGYIEIDTDITERKQVEEELHKAKQDAEAANLAKSVFLANMSHEIRTPMNAIIGMTELAMQTGLTSEQREYLGVVKASSDSLLTIINDILDFSKIEAGRLDVESIPFWLRECLGDTMKLLALQAHEKGLELAYEIAPEIPDGLIGDPVRLRQIVINLVGNAIKFTEHGEVVLRVALETATADEITCRFSVMDTGIGIPRDKQASIFAPFLQADTSTTRNYGGTGLGLSISARLVDRMKGRIWVESEPGRETTFYFTVRFGVRPAEQRAAVPDFNGLTALVVDDHPASRSALASMLGGWQLDVHEADGKRSALQHIARAAREGRPFRLVLLDDTLPGADGYAIAERLANSPGLGVGAIIMLSTSLRRDGDARDHGSAAFTCLTKPVRPSELLDALNSVLGQSPRAEDQTVSTIPVVPSVATTRREILLVEDNPVNQKVARRILEKRGHRVTVVDSGAAAVEVLGQRRYDLVLLDVQMPGMDGIETAAAIRSNERATGGHVPIVALTAHAMEGDRERCLQAGMDGYLTKPVQSASLFEAIDRLCAAAVPSGPAVLDRDALLERVDGDVEFLGEIADLFLRDCGKLMARARDAIRRREASQLAFVLHTLRGMLGNLSANAAQDAAEKLQQLDVMQEPAQTEAAFAVLEEEIELLKAKLIDVTSEMAA